MKPELQEDLVCAIKTAGSELPIEIITVFAFSCFHARNCPKESVVHPSAKAQDTILFAPRGGYPYTLHIS